MVAAEGVVRDEDAQISLLMLYELHYRGIIGVRDSWEWQPDLLAVRAVLEDQFETEIRNLTTVPGVPADGDVAGLLFGLTAPQPASLSKFLAQRATVTQFREFLIHRSVYHVPGKGRGSPGEDHGRPRRTRRRLRRFGVSGRVGGCRPGQRIVHDWCQ